MMNKEEFLQHYNAANNQMTILQKLYEQNGDKKDEKLASLYSEILEVAFNSYREAVDLAYEDYTSCNSS